MPAPLNVNREAVKTLAIALGVRAAAREMGLDESTVRQWSSRGKWFAKPSQPPTVRPVATVTKAPSDVMAAMGENTKFHLAKAGEKASKYFRGLPGSKVAKQSGDFKNVAQALAPIHGWDQKSGAAANVMVNVALLGVNPGELGVSGDVS